MRSIILAITLVGCTTPHAIVSDRTDCTGCHTAPAITDPPPGACMATDHTTYAATCYQCHGTTSWCPAVKAATQTHPKFDLTKASHAGWDCADCHLSITYDPPAIPDPTMIACTNCHWHDQAQTDPHHVGKSNYVYGPATCLASECHGGGRRQ